MTSRPGPAGGRPRAGNPAGAGRRAAGRLDALYARVPDPGCLGLCVESCHSCVAAPAERGRVRAATGVRLPPVHAGSPCAALGADGRCAVYAHRPLVCRLFGAVDHPLMRCPFGCRPAGGLLPAAEGRRLLRLLGRVA